MSFIELVLEGGHWVEELPPFESPLLARQNLANARVFTASEQADFSLVEPELVIRRFRLNPSAPLVVQNSLVMSWSENIVEELTVDDEIRTSGGKRLKAS